ncbi:hypothetical protein EZY14_019615 [Kordia sp. TARA_039_SRF]|jgi:hypothetical protein|nr:hypothetical protein EZY14_019615 [Kordia sp. TARA_039_SRF]MAF31650.1 hypothetical protein [Magnetococcales bacterium]|tara:strand:- start:2250 stop:2558 length:309 start_codon:yes stop_codon:yes gene_type:complete
MAKKLHYDKDALVQEYKKTLTVMAIATGAVVAFALVYFFIMAVYLGEKSHTKYEPYFETFEMDGRIEGSYEGLKLKASELVNPEANDEYYKKKPHVKGDAAH